jgi:hypothetical protein
VCDDGVTLMSACLARYATEGMRTIPKKHGRFMA